jgi:DMSO/TMAO reductase YedYZ molybdopterin-dependent catalytic subunit
LFAAGCSKLADSGPVSTLIHSVEEWNRDLHNLLGRRSALAREFSPEHISPTFRGNGTTQPTGEAYAAHQLAGFADWKLTVTGLVDQELSLSMDEIRALPQRTQITRHDCVEGWSVIGQWTGVPLAHLLSLARPAERATHVGFHCFDDLSGDGGRYYVSIDLRDALHPQTLVAYGLNGARLGVANGAPLRMRIERKLGYKQPKYLAAIELRAGYAGLAGGRGGYWEDRGYDWYAGI